jgi:hypothetical protein
MMELLELLLYSFTPNFNNITECAPEKSGGSLSADMDVDKIKLAKKTSRDVSGCIQAHQKIEKGEGQQITPVVKYASHVDDKGRKTTAFQARTPLGFFDMTGCLSEPDKKT